MGRHSFLFLSVGLFLVSQTAFAQPKRIAYNNQQLFLSGANLAWVNYNTDIGSGSLDTASFKDIMQSIHDHGGNAMRWWLHTEGTVTPQFDGAGYVIGPGTGAIADIKKVLDFAWEREIGVDLCLWNYKMLLTANVSTAHGRDTLLLTDTNYTRAYINNCLIPMVDSLKGHPAILCWEIFNEPEGMSNEFGWSAVYHVPMSVIQRFVNLCTGAIHRADPKALVTNGAWSFISNTDMLTPLSKKSSPLSQRLSRAEQESIASQINQKYKLSETTDEIINDIDRLSDYAHKNYYSDAALRSAGGDPDGTLDFYSVHYYPTIQPDNPTGISPFQHPASAWYNPYDTGKKPIVIAEFPMEENNGGVPTALLFDTLYQLGYAGALPWSWTDVQFSSQAHMLAGMQSMWDNHRSDIDVIGIAFSWPSITITNPSTGASYPDSTSLTFYVTVSDTLPISSVAFYADTTKIGVVTTPYSTSYDTSFYTFRWNSISPGSYTMTAIATNSGGHQKVSNTVLISIGKPPMVRLEAESTPRSGPGMKTMSDPTASNGAYVDVGNLPGTTCDTTSKITWYFTNVAPAGTYEIAFGYKLNYASPKSQYINVNGVRVDTVEFTAASTTTWYEKTMSVPLVQGSNNIQMQMYWGWMSLDDLAVPKVVLTSVRNNIIVPVKFALEQNYPNPFNPSTTINFSVPTASNIKLTVFNLLGQKVVTLADKYMEAGVYTMKFDASQLASGVYFYRLEAGKFISQKKMLLLR